MFFNYLIIICLKKTMQKQKLLKNIEIEKRIQNRVRNKRQRNSNIDFISFFIEKNKNFNDKMSIFFYVSFFELYQIKTNFRNRLCFFRN